MSYYSGVQQTDRFGRTVADIANAAAADAAANLAKPGAPGKWAVMGDSITALNFTADIRTSTNSTTTLIQPPMGYANWLSALSNQQIQIEPAGMFARSGAPSVEVARYLDPDPARAATLGANNAAGVLAYAPNWVVIHCGTNDGSLGYTLAQSVAAFTTMFQRLTRAGIKIVAMLTTPRITQNNSGNGLGQVANLQLLAINQFIRRYAQTNGNIVVVDPRFYGWTIQAQDIPTATATLDGLHNSAVGAYLEAKGILTSVTPFLQLNDSGASESIYDSYDVPTAGVNNPTGNMLTNGLILTKGGGTVTSTPSGVMTGTAPSTMTMAFNGQAGATYTGSVACTYLSGTSRRGLNQIQATVTNLSNGLATVPTNRDSISVYQAVVMPAGLNPGDIVEGMCEIDIVGTPVGLLGIELDMIVFDGSGSSVTISNMGYPFSSTGNSAANLITSQVFPQQPLSVTLKTMRYPVPAVGGAGNRQISLVAYIYLDTSTGTGPCTLTATLNSFSVRRVVSPTVAGLAGGAVS